MFTPLSTLLISAGVLALLLVIFFIEAKRGRRLGEGLRRVVDRLVHIVYNFCKRIGSFLEREVIRQTFHYLFHRLLRGVLSLLQKIEHSLDMLLRTNRALARRISEERKTRTQLDEIAEHRESTALTPKQKLAHKERSIGTRL